MLQAELCPRCFEPNPKSASWGVRAELTPLTTSLLVISEGISVPQRCFWAARPRGPGPGIHTRAWDLEGTEVLSQLPLPSPAVRRVGPVARNLLPDSVPQLQSQLRNAITAVASACHCLLFATIQLYLGRAERERNNNDRRMEGKI